MIFEPIRDCHRGNNTNAHMNFGKTWTCVLVGFLSLAAQAGRNYIPNHSFESPETPFVDQRIDSWQRTPKPFWYDESGGFTWEQLTGTFLNTPPGTNNHIHNIDGKQAIYLFAVPTVGIFQDFNSIPGTNSSADHKFDARFESGKSYRLTAGLIGGGGGMSNGVSLELSLYYRDGASNFVTVASTNVTYGPEIFLDATNFVDIAIQSLPVKLQDAWMGKNVGIQILSTVNPALAGGYWDVDNVRLEEIIELPNGSFENPQTVFVDNRFAGWEKNPKPFWYDEFGGFLWDQLSGIFANPGAGDPKRKDNIDGNQAAYLFAVPEVGLFQDMLSVDGFTNASTLNAVYEPGKSYQFTLGVSGGGGGMSNGTTLQLSFYYRDANSNHVTISSAFITNAAATFPVTTHFVDFSVHLPGILASDAWAGKPVGVKILSTVDPTLSGGYWDIDKARLEVRKVPMLELIRSNNSTGLVLTSEPGLAFSILNSTNLAANNSWTHLLSITNQTGKIAIPAPTGNEMEFFQVQQLP